MDACVCPTTRLLGVTGHQGRARACQRGACLFGDNTRVHFRRARVSVSTRPAVFLGSARVAVPHGHSLVRVGGACVSVLLPVTALCPGTLSVCAHYSTCAACSLRASHRGCPSASKLCPAGSQAQRPSVCLTVTSPHSSGPVCASQRLKTRCVSFPVPLRAMCACVRVTATVPRTHQPRSDSREALRAAASRYPHGTAPCAREVGVCGREGRRQREAAEGESAAAAAAAVPAGAGRQRARTSAGRAAAAPLKAGGGRGRARSRRRSEAERGGGGGGGGSSGHHVGHPGVQRPHQPPRRRRAQAGAQRAGR